MNYTILGIFGRSKISNFTAPIGAGSFGHIQLIGQEVIFNWSGSFAAIRIRSGQLIIQDALTVAASM